MTDLPGISIPNPNGRIERSSDHAFSVERNSVNLMIMPSKDMQACTSVNVPHLSLARRYFIPDLLVHLLHSVPQDRNTYPASIVIAARSDLIPSDLDTPHALFMTGQRTQQLSRFEIPDT